jgi:hypothetical protein
MLKFKIEKCILSVCRRVGAFALRGGNSVDDEYIICERCGRECEVACQALVECRDIYAAQKLADRKKLIYRLRKLLDIRDAEPSKEMARLGRRIISRVEGLRFIADFNIRVGYVESLERKTKGGREVYGDCRKINKVYGAYLPFDFIITFYAANIGHLSENQLKLLMWHELKHIGMGDRGPTLEPHDIEDFYAIIDTHGTRWSELGADVVDILG